MVRSTVALDSETSLNVTLPNVRALSAASLVSRNTIISAIRSFTLPPPNLLQLRAHHVMSYRYFGNVHLRLFHNDAVFVLRNENATLRPRSRKYTTLNARSRIVSQFNSDN